MMSVGKFLILVAFSIGWFTGSLAIANEPMGRVLILGDSIYRQPAAAAAKELKGRVQVVYATVSPDQVLHSESLLQNLDELLSDGPWDVIHFNVGLGDLIYRAGNMKSFRVLPKHAGGVRATTPTQYERNLHQCVPRLKATGAKLVWASTTPIRASTTGVFDPGSEVEYNDIAAKVMKAHQVPIHDMHGYVKNLIDMNKPAGHGADPFHFDRKPIHAPLVEVILSQLSAASEVNASP
jgi:hypothetical protein